jgi:hypothetical protein
MTIHATHRISQRHVIGLALVVVGVLLRSLLDNSPAAASVPALHRKTCAVTVLTTSTLLANSDTPYAAAQISDDARGWYQFDRSGYRYSVYELQRGDQVRGFYPTRINPDSGRWVRELEGGAWIDNGALSRPFDCD